MTQRNTESFRPQFNVDDVIKLVGHGNKSNFYNQAVIKEISYRKKNSNATYRELKEKVREKTRNIETRNKEIENIENTIEQYDKRLKRLRKKQEKDQKELIDMNRELERIRITKKTSNAENREYKQLLEENKESIEQITRLTINLIFKEELKAIPITVVNVFNNSIELKNTFGTFENFINRYFYSYIEKEVMQDSNFEFERYINREQHYTDVIREEDKEKLKKVVKNRTLLDVPYIHN